jgi:hypothetical protein
MLNKTTDQIYGKIHFLREKGFTLIKRTNKKLRSVCYDFFSVIWNESDNTSQVNRKLRNSGYLLSISQIRQIAENIRKKHPQYQLKRFCNYYNNYETAMNIAAEKMLLRKIVDPLTECWEFSVNNHHTGYSNVCVCGKQIRAHRFSYMFWNNDKNEIPSGFIIRHKCDNKGCFNPKHLEIGTATDNAQDTVKRNRRKSQKGHLNGNSRLTPQQVAEIRDKYVSLNSLARTYKVDSNTIKKIVYYNSYVT